MSELQIGVIVGSISATSINRRLFTGLRRLAPSAGLAMTDIPINTLPLFDHDLESDYPEPARILKESIAASDGILIITPEYNRSIPGVLKNALDWSSRPKGTNVFAGRPTGVIGTSAGALGTALAQQHLRSVLAFLAAPVMTQPEAYVRMTPGLIADDGEITDERNAIFLTAWLQSFRDHVARHLD